MQQKRLRGKGGRSRNVIFSQERGRYVKPVFPKGVGLDSLGGRAWARGLASALQCPVGSLPELPCSASEPGCRKDKLPVELSPSLQTPHPRSCSRLNGTHQ